MKNLPVEELEAGAVYSKPVFIDGEHLLVQEGVAIKQRDIDRLKKWKIDSVLTDGVALSSFSANIGPVDTVSDILDQKGNPEQLEFYKRIVMKLDRKFDEIKANQQIDKKELDALIELVVDNTLKSPDEMVALVLRNDQAEVSLGKSAMDCCILSVVVGTSLSMDEVKLKVLGFGAMLHDIGMVHIPDSILTKKSDLNVEEIKLIRTHTLHSYKIVSKDLGYPEAIGMITLQHHERWDGKGYPRRLSEKHISVEARIVTVADAFEAMVKVKPYRNSMIGYTAMRQLLNDNSRRFDSEILKAFIQAIGIYPLGSYVLLNNGGIGRVLKINPGAPLRPVIKVLIDPSGARHLQGDGPLINLLDDKNVFIAKAIDPNNALGAKKTV